jgi:ribonucleoside-diphosphate reductase alpha chain
MGLADLALSMKIAYGSDNFQNVLEEIMKSMANSAAQASALRAKERGVFPKYDFEKIAYSSFYQEVYSDETKDMIKAFGLRNSRLLSIAPTGSISNVLGVSGGVEPYFMLGYQREIQSMFSEVMKIWVYERTPLKLMKFMGVDNHTQLPDWARVTSQNIDFERRANVQAIIQKYVDTAISSTFNIPNGASVEDVMNIYMSAWKKGFKGATVFRDRCAKIGILMGINENSEDLNPGVPPKMHIEEKWYNKKSEEIKDYVTNVTIENQRYKPDKMERELCPLCGSVLIKKQGCIQCISDLCDYEKCSV